MYKGKGSTVFSRPLVLVTCFTWQGKADCTLSTKDNTEQVGEGFHEYQEEAGRRVSNGQLTSLLMVYIPRGSLACCTDSSELDVSHFKQSEEVEVLSKRVNTGMRFDRQLVRGKSFNQIGKEGVECSVI